MKRSIYTISLAILVVAYGCKLFPKKEAEVFQTIPDIDTMPIVDTTPKFIDKDVYMLDEINSLKV